MANLEYMDLTIEQQQMPPCPLCSNPIYGGEPVVIGRVKAHGQVAFALTHQDCAEEN